MYASLSSKNASDINFTKFQVLCFEATESDAQTKVHLFKLQTVKPKTCSCNCPASVSCYSKLTLELCCYKGLATGHALKKTSCPKYWTYWTWELHHWRSIWYYLRSKCQGQLCCTNVWHPGKTHGAGKVRLFSVNVLLTCIQNPSLRTHHHIWFF